MKITLILICLFVATVSIIATIWVEREAKYTSKSMGGDGPAKALVLYHPSRDAHLSDDIANALVVGLKGAGYAVDLATITRQTPATPKGYALIAVVSNTYWWTPDRPTLRFLDHGNLQGVRVIGVIGGAGATSRSQKMLESALRKAAGNVICMRSLWVFRPNEERVKEPNRMVAIQIARKIGEDCGRGAMRTG